MKIGEEMRECLRTEWTDRALICDWLVKLDNRTSRKPEHPEYGD